MERFGDTFLGCPDSNQGFDQSALVWIGGETHPALSEAVATNSLLPSWQVQKMMVRKIAQKEGGQKGIVYSNESQDEVEIGAAPFPCGLIVYHLKLDSFLS